MRSMKYIGHMLLLMLGIVVSTQAFPPVLNYAGQVAVNGEAFDGNGLFKFDLVLLKLSTGKEIGKLVNKLSPAQSRNT